MAMWRTGSLGTSFELQREIVHTGPWHAKRLGHLPTGIAHTHVSKACFKLLDDLFIADFRRNWRSDQHDEFAAEFTFGKGGSEITEPPAPDLFVKLGKLSRDHSVAIEAQHLGHINQGLSNPRRRLEKREGRGDLRQLCKAGAPRSRLGREKASEQKAIRRQPGAGQRCDRRRWARNAENAMTLGRCLTHQLKTGIRDEWRASVADKRDSPLSRKLIENPRQLPLLVVLVKRSEFAR